MSPQPSERCGSPNIDGPDLALACAASHDDAAEEQPNHSGSAFQVAIGGTWCEEAERSGEPSSVAQEHTAEVLVNALAQARIVAQPPLQAIDNPRWPLPLLFTHRQRVLKRTFDLCLVVPAILLLAPVFLLIALLVWLSSGRPVVFSQLRVGEGGSTFLMFKFRSMCREAEERVDELCSGEAVGSAVDKQADDPRITPVGRFLRRTSLDELPQLFNVLQGNMSLVGPRPELLRLARNYTSWQWERFSVPPGLTCLWQIRGRSTRGVVQKSLDDLEYIRTYSLWLDLKILLATIPVVLQGRGAY